MAAKASTERFRRTLEGHTNTVSSLTTCNGKLVSGSWDGTVRVWNTANGACPLPRDAAPTLALRCTCPRIDQGCSPAGTCECVLQGHEDNVTSVSSLDNGRVVSTSVDSARPGLAESVQ